MTDLLAKARTIITARTCGPWKAMVHGSRIFVDSPQGDAPGPIHVCETGPIDCKAIALLGTIADEMLAVCEAAKALMAWDTGDAMNERDRADASLRRALAALERKLATHFVSQAGTLYPICPTCGARSTPLGICPSCRNEG